MKEHTTVGWVVKFRCMDEGVFVKKGTIHTGNILDAKVFLDYGKASANAKLINRYYKNAYWLTSKAEIIDVKLTIKEI